MSDYSVKEITIQEAEPFIKKWHYSKNTNGISTRFVLGLYDGDDLIGVIIFAYLAMASVWKKYGDIETDVVELRRLACTDDAPKNTESWFISKAIRWLKENTSCKVVISYADTMYGHSGVIYQASNFLYLGKTAKGKAIRIKDNDRLYHEKTIRTYYTNSEGVKKLKPYAQKIKDQLSNGEADYIHSDGKHIYLFPLNKKERKKWTPLIKAY